MFDHRDERTDADLLAATRDGDRTALEALYVRHAPWLLVRLSRQCADRSWSTRWSRTPSSRSGAAPPRGRAGARSRRGSGASACTGCWTGCAAAGRPRSPCAATTSWRSRPRTRCCRGSSSASRSRFAGTPAELVEHAAGRVWLDRIRGAGAQLAWRNGDGLMRNVGHPPSGAELTAPTLEDAYLLLVGQPEPAVAS